MKALHDYAVFNHNRSTIGRWLGVIAVLSAGGISSLFALAGERTGLQIFQTTIATGAVYALLHYIFNRWGEKIFYSKGYEEPFAGQNKNGKDLPVGTYFYVITFNDELGTKPRTGSVTIMR